MMNCTNREIIQYIFSSTNVFEELDIIQVHGKKNMLISCGVCFIVAIASHPLVITQIGLEKYSGKYKNSLIPPFFPIQLKIFF